MPNWKKVIISGSDASLNSLLVTDNIELTGSLNVSGSTTQIGNNTLLGNTTLSGSIIISGSEDTANPTVRIYGNTQHDGVIRFDPVNTNIDSSISASYIYVSGSTDDLYFSQNGRGYSNTTRLRWLEGNINTGILYGGIVSGTPGSTTFNVAAGEGLITTMNAFTASEGPNPIINNVEWDAFTSQSITNLAVADTTWLLIDGNGNLIQQTSSPTELQFRENIQVGVVLHPNRTNITLVKSFTQPSYAATQQLFTFVRSFGGIKISGHTISANGTNLSLDRSAGTTFAIGRNYAFDPDNPSLMSDAASSAPGIFRYYASGSGFATTTGTTVIDPDNYNTPSTPTGLSSMDPNKFQIQRIFFFPKSPDTLGVYYGRQQYGTIAQALQNLPFEEFEENDNTRNQAVFLGYLIVESGATDLTDTDEARFIQAGAFRTTGAGGAASAPVVTNLEDLNDVTISSVATGDLLYWAGAEWQNTNILDGITITGSFQGDLEGNADTATSSSYAATASSGVDGFTVHGDLDVDGNITGSALQLGNLGAENEILIVGANTQVTSSNLLAIDTVNQRVGIGTSTPQVKLDLVGESSGEAQVRVAQHDDTSDGPDIRFFKSHGTAAASSSVANNDYIGAVNAFAYDGSTYIQSGFFGFQADGTDGDSKFGLRTRVGGALTDRITIDAAGDVGIRGSLEVQSAVTASSYTGSFIGDGSGLTGIISSSYAVTASHALNAGGSTALAFSYFNVQNSSLADNATYRLGQMTSLQTSVNAVAHIPLPSGTITEAYIGVYNASTFASGENITVNFLSDGGATSNTLSSTVTATSRHQEFIITGLSISINAGRTFVNIETPSFTTNPTAVQFRVGIKLEL